jgi:hypothetical protein
MDRSASIRVAPEPCRSGDIEISGKAPENSGDGLQTTLSIVTGGCKPEAVSRPAFAGDPAELPALGRRNRRRSFEWPQLGER